MTGLDTNVLVRYIMQDDAKQSAMANALIDSLTGQAPGFVPLAAVVELVWGLSSCYGLTRAQLAQALAMWPGATWLRGLLQLSWAGSAPAAAPSSAPAALRAAAARCSRWAGSCP